MANMAVKMFDELFHEERYVDILQPCFFPYFAKLPFSNFIVNFNDNCFHEFFNILKVVYHFYC